MKSPMETDRLGDMVREVKAELDPDGAGYRTQEAVNLLCLKARDGVTIPAEALHLMRLGGPTALKNYFSTIASFPMAERAALIGQRDFAEVVPDMDWFEDESALDETHTAVRKRNRSLDRWEMLKVIRLKHRKGVENLAVSDAMQRVVDAYPNWADEPWRTLEEIMRA